MKKITFEKGNKTVEVFEKNNKIVVIWGDQTGTATKIIDEKLYIKGIKHNDNYLTGFLIENPKIAENLEKLFQDFKNKKNNIKTKIINDIISGEKKIEWGIVGCDFPHYQPWVSVPEGWNFSAQDIMQEAVETIIGEHISKNICNWLEKLLNIDIIKNEEKKDFFSNIQNNEKAIEQYGNKAIVISFETKLFDILNIYFEKKKIQDKKEKEKEKEIKKIRENAIEKAKKENNNVFVRNVGGYDGDADGKGLGWVQISEYATPAGKIIIEESACY